MKRLLKRIAVLFLCVSLTQLAFSQTKVITGKVTDANGAPVQGASVSVKGSKGGTTTDANGAFSITVSSTASSLIISSVGFNQVGSCHWRPDGIKCCTGFRHTITQ